MPREEMTRAMDVLGKQTDRAYFIGYQVNEIRSVNIEASLGALKASDTDHTRYLDIDVRVGDYGFDSTHPIRGPRGTQNPPNFTTPVLMPIENDLDALKSVIWLETDRRYKAAVERWIQVKANRTIKVDEEDTSADLSREKNSGDVLPVAVADVRVPDWESKVKSYSALFAKYPEILDGSAGFSATATNQYLVNSEGTTVESGTSQLRLSIYARTKAEDGMELFRFESFDAHTAAGMVGDAVVRQAIDKMVNDLLALRQAPIIDPFTGPAILSGRASGVFFHEIFGHRIEGHRQKSEDEGQTFTKQINKPVLPDFITVIDNPTAKQSG
jgi:hypothetical protein